jgi:hypothetical protein
MSTRILAAVVLALMVFASLGEARILNPSLGRWLSRDPARYVDGPNLYRYGVESPITARDPSGLASACASCNPPTCQWDEMNMGNLQPGTITNVYWTLGCRSCEAALNALSQNKIDSAILGAALATCFMSARAPDSLCSDDCQCDKLHSQQVRASWSGCGTSLQCISVSAFLGVQGCPSCQICATVTGGGVSYNRKEADCNPKPMAMAPIAVLAQ